MDIEVVCADEERMLAHGGQLAKALRAPLVIFLQGDLGMGKTTLVRGVLRGLGFNGRVKSPTFSIVEPYELDQMTLYHFDLYRLGDGSELEAMGIRDYFTTDSVCFIEWPDHGLAQLPPADLNCYIDHKDCGRLLRWQSCSPSGQIALEKFKT